MSFKDDFKKRQSAKESKVLTMDEFLHSASKDSSFYAGPAERLLKAIGDPKYIDTTQEPRLNRIFSGRLIKVYDAFSDFFGAEDVIERITSFLKHASQGLEESRQILYLLGPPGSAKSSFAERLKLLMEQQPIYVLVDAEGNRSPINESPLGLFSQTDSKALKIPIRYLEIKASPWTIKRLQIYENDISKFSVMKSFPSSDRQIAICKTEPGDETNQDISTLVGKLDIRKLEFYEQKDPDAYSYSGGLCLANQGLLDFVEMFKAPIKVLNPLLTATQERNYKGTEAIGSIPFDGVILAHSNESEWEIFKNNKQNEALLDRTHIIEVPYCLRVDEEIKIYKKLLTNSALLEAPCAPGTLETLAQFVVASRLDIPEHSNLSSKVLVYNGQNVRDKDVSAKSYQDYKDKASHAEGFRGISTRLAFQVISETFNFDALEEAADPVHLMEVIKRVIKKERYDEDTTARYVAFLTEYLAPEYAKQISKDIQTALLDSYDEFGQALFDRYVKYADHWIQDTDYRDADTGQMFDRELLNKELERVEKAAQISNPKDFRHEVVNFSLRYQAQHEGHNPDWKSYQKLRKVIEENMFSNTEDMLPIISFQGNSSSDDKRKHQDFVDRMKEKGYTERQVKRLVEWHMRYIKS